MKEQRIESMTPSIYTIVTMTSFIFLLLVSWAAPASGIGKIAFTRFLDSNCEIAVIDEDGRNLENLSGNRADDIYPVWSPDGQYIAFSSNRKDKSYNIYIMDSDGSNERQITNDPLDDIMPSFSPDGRQITFTRMSIWNPRIPYKIFLISIDRNNEKFLTDGAAPDWSPDGKKIAFCRRDLKGAPNNIWVIDRKGNNPVKITAQNLNDTEPAWSPDGKQIVFSSQRAQFGISNIYKMDSNGANVVRLTEENAQHVEPIWSPNGEHIAFSILPGLGRRRSEIVIIESDDGEQKIVFEGGGPSWFDPAFASYAVDAAGKLASPWGALKKK